MPGRTVSLRDFPLIHHYRSRAEVYVRFQDLEGPTSAQSKTGHQTSSRPWDPEEYCETRGIIKESRSIVEGRGVGGHVTWFTAA